MERNMYQDESFERMLKQKADEYKMYPAGKVWEQIQQRVQKKNYLFNFKSTSLTLLLLTTFSLYISNDQQTHLQLSTRHLQTLLPASQQEPSVAAVPNETVLIKNIAVRKNQIQVTVAAAEPLATGENTAIAEIKTELQPTTVQPEQVTETITINNNIVADESITEEEQTLSKVGVETIETTLLPGTSNMAPEQRLPGLSVQVSEIVEPESPTLKTDAELNYEVNIPLLLKPKLKKEIQYYITPSASYRILYAENLFAFGNIPAQDPDNAVTHKAALGFEAGAAVLFPVTSKFRFVAGLQLNYTRYTVNAYKSSPQMTTVRLNYAGVQQRVSTLNNVNGFWPDNVANETYQVAIPLGFQAQLAGNKKLQWNIAAEVQPTYMMKASGYLITNDYTKYIQAPDLLSHLNLNTSLQTFISWNARNYRFIAGPQFRYQLFSNAPEYPIQEHLIDYGFRIGFVKTLR